LIIFVAFQRSADIIIHEAGLRLYRYIPTHCSTQQIDSTKARHNRRLTRRPGGAYRRIYGTRHNIIYYYFILIIIRYYHYCNTRLVRVAFDMSMPSPRVPPVCRPLSPRGRGVGGRISHAKTPRGLVYNIQVLIILIPTHTHTHAHTIRVYRCPYYILVYYTCTSGYFI